MRAPGDARKRILILFFLGIAFPSFLLGYLAFRGIQNDQALIEQERQNRHRVIAALIAESLEAGLAQIEQSLFRTTSALQEAEPEEVLQGLDSLRLREPLIQVLFSLETSGAVRLVAEPLLFSREVEDAGLGTPPAPPQALTELREARILELRDQDHARALAAYQQVYSGASEERIRGEALNAIARIQTRSGSFLEAADSYERLRREFGKQRMENGTPFGAAAQLELGSVRLVAGDSAAATLAFLDLFRSLLGGEWRMTEPEFDFFALKVRETLGDLLARGEVTPFIEAYRDTLANLSEVEAAKREKTEELHAFSEAAGDVMLARLATLQAGEPSETGRRYLRMTLEVGGHSHHVSVPMPGTQSGTDPQGAWGILFDPEALRNDLLRPVIGAHTASDPIGWLVTDRTGDTILASAEPPRGSSTVTATLGNEVLPYTLELFQPTPRLVETFLTSRRGVYFYAFLLLAGILIFGLTLTIRSVTHQLALSRLKSDFVSTISHEFKSPLTAIRHLTEILNSDRVPSDDRRKQYYRVMLEQIGRLSLLIDNVLDLAKMEEGRHELELETVDVSDLLREIVEAVDHRVHHDGFHIRAEVEDPGPTMLLDAEAITQATTNLIDNAVRYSGESREVVVHGYSDRTHFNIAVEDFGIGMSADETRRVFERFYRGGDELTRSVKGTGLGLSLVKRIAEAHGGSVLVESEPGRGSTFSIKLPLAAPAGGNDG